MFNRIQSSLRSVILLCVMLRAIPAMSQYEWLSTLNYSSLALNRIANISGVTWVAGDNSTYDANNQRFFFQGNPTGALPWNLYTINALTGGVLYEMVCPSPSLGGQVLGLQYDNLNNTLYAMHISSTGAAYFSSVDPATGNITHITPIPNYLGYTQSTFDTNDQFYIVSNGGTLLVINAVTGVLIFNPPNPYLSDIVYDNMTGKLYGINLSSSFPNPQFDSMTLSTGALHVLSNLSPLILQGINAYTIDEHAGKYMFVAADPLPPSGCVSNYLYILDINTGGVLSKTLYPYAQGTSVLTDENFISFSFDNKRGVLYGLNWYPPGSTIPAITITASPNPVCAGIPVNYTAAGGELTSSPSYQWQLNGKNVGTNSPAYTNSNPVTGDSVICILINPSACLPVPPDTSNGIVITVNPIVATSVLISSSAGTICSGDTVLFTAVAIGGGADPAYQWEINGVPTGTRKDSFLYAGLQNQDSVYCIMTGDISCSLPVSSNKITTIVNISPSLLVGNDTVITPGQTIMLDPTVTGEIVSYQWTPVLFMDNPSVKNPHVNPSATTIYQLTVSAANSCTASGKIIVTVYHPLKMPNAFTPNGDGLNDVFRIPPQTTQKIMSFSVFNRWGEMLFRTTNPGEGWDGSFKGQLQPAGSYIWEINYEDLLTGKNSTGRGSVVLIR